jgi:uncharacterized protein (TIGR02217 family)
MVMILSDIKLSNRVLAAGIKGKTMRKNMRTANQGGFVSANILWHDSLRQYEVGIVPMLRAAWADLESTYEATYGGAYGFLMEDPKDHAAVFADGVVAYDGTNWRLYKRYQPPRSTSYVDRKITRPKEGAQIKVNGTLSVGSSADPETGIVTLAGGAGSGDEITWAGDFYVPVHFSSDVIDWTILRGGAYDNRLVAGPSVVIDEVRE